MMVTLVYAIHGDCSGRTTQCNSLGSASLVYERLKFLNALPTRIGSVDNVPQVDPSDGTYYYVNVTGFHQGSDTDIAEGNRGGSYLTFMSTPGLMFGIINIVGNFGTVFVDQSYWQSAIAASPASARRATCSAPRQFTILHARDAWPRRQRPQRGHHLGRRQRRPRAPAAAAVLGGRGMAIPMIIMLFDITDRLGLCIAVVAWSYDFYRAYINPNATGQDILKQSRIMVAVWALCMFFFNWILWGIGLSLGWVYNFMGIMIGSAVFPVAMVICWSRMSAIAAIAGAWGGMILAVISWLVYAGADGGAVNVETTGILEAQPPAPASPSARRLHLVDPLADQRRTRLVEDERGHQVRRGRNTLGSGYESTDEFLMEAKAWIMKYGIGWTFFLIFVWPAATIPWGVFNESIYSLWASIAISWGYLASIIIIFYPIVENFNTVWRVITCDPVKPGAAATTTASKEIETSNA